jgi:hypothetical protein
MTRKKAQSMPATIEPPGIDIPDETPEVSLPSSAVIEVPLGNLVEGGHLSRHVEARLDQRQREALRRLYSGLYDARTKLANGKFVLSNADAIRWLLEQLVAA